MLQLIYTQALKFFPFSETSLRAFHNELLQYYTPSAHYRGGYKTAPNSVVRKNAATGETLSVLETFPAGPITESAMRDLIDWYNDILPVSLDSCCRQLSLFFIFLPSTLSRMETKESA